MNMDWLRKLYKWCAFQKNYDKIKAMSLPPDVDKLLDEIWKKLPKYIQDAIWELIKKIVKEYSEDAAIIILNNILKGFKNNIAFIK